MQAAKALSRVGKCEGPGGVKARLSIGCSPMR